MKLQDLDKTKRYDLRGKSKEQIKLIEEFCCKDNHTLVIKNLEIEDDGFYVLAWNGEFKSNIWHISEDWDYELEEPIFILDDDAENKQEQFLNELQQLCKKYDAGIYDIMDNCGIEIRLPKMNYIYLNMINEDEIDKEE